MTVITEELDLPGGQDPTGVTVKIRLRPSLGYTGDPATIIGTLDVTPDADGSWSADLVPNSEITPAGTVYFIQLEGGDNVSKRRRYISVPDAGPVAVQDILTDEPASVQSSALALHAAKRGLGGHLPDAADDGQVPAYNAATEEWEAVDQSGGGGGAPTDATYLTTTANGTLSNEVVVGATPGGELGGTWASPTVDATHSGSSHASVQAAAEATAAAALSAHAADTTAIHGIADTSALETTAGAQAKVDAAIAALLDGAPGALDTLNELAAALGDDASFAASVTTALAGKQPLDSELTALAGLTSAADRVPYFTGSGTAALGTFTSFGRSLVDDGSAAAARITLGLDINCPADSVTDASTSINSVLVSNGAGRNRLPRGTIALNNPIIIPNGSTLDAWGGMQGGSTLKALATFPHTTVSGAQTTPSDDTTTFTLDVASTAGFPLGAGGITPPNGTGVLCVAGITIFYTGVTSTSFTGCRVQDADTDVSLANGRDLSTFMVWLCDPAATSAGFGTKIENVGIDANGVAGISGIHSCHIQEGGGWERVRVTNFKNFGIRVDSNPASGGGDQAVNYSGGQAWIIFNSAAEAEGIGIDILHTYVATHAQALDADRGFRDVTVVVQGSATQVGKAAVRLNGATGRYGDLHLENMNDGILVGDIYRSSVMVENVWVASGWGTGAVLHVANTSGNKLTARHIGKTNASSVPARVVLDDDITSVSVTDEEVTSYELFDDGTYILNGAIDVVAGSGISVDATDPTAPVVTAEVTQAELDGKQPLDSDLTAIAALSTTSFGRALLELADAAALRTAGGLGTMAVEAAADYVTKALYDANSLLIATSDNTPIALPVAASRILGRKASGDIDDMTTAELAALFGTPTGSKFLADDGTLKTPSAGSLTSSSNYVSSDVTMTTAGTYYDGPSLTLAAGTWLLHGVVGVIATTNAQRVWQYKLWDGTTTTSEGQHVSVGSAATNPTWPLPVSAIVTPGGSTTYKISVTSNVNGDKIRGTSWLGSYLNAIKIA